MCATFQLADDDVEEIHRITRDIDAKYGEGTAQARISHDFFPKQEIPVVGPGNKVALLRWGFPMGNSKQVVFNARAESLRDKPMFRSRLQNRCLIPATRFYEFGGDKTKYKVTFKSMPFFYMAGLWTRETTAEGGKHVYATIITTAPNGDIGKVHNRMPVVFAGADALQWLGGGMESLDLLRTCEALTVLKAV